jgi:imidazolonepropionase-like amidohydrolase
MNPSLLLSMSLLATQPQDSGTVVFEHVAVVLADSGRVRFDQTVVVHRGRIARVGPASSVSMPPAASRIDGRGRYLLPGLVDLHAHLTARDFPLFLVNGVTTVREMNGSPAHLAWRDSVNAGLLAGPSLVVSSPLLAGVPQRYRHELIRTPAEAVAAVQLAARLGYDALKVYDGLSRDAYQALAEEAARTGLSLTGHVPLAVGLEGLAPGQRSVEHTQEILRGLDPHTADSAAIDGRVALLMGTGVAVTPTLAVFERLSLSGTAEVQALFDRPEMALVDSSIAAWWSSFRRPSPAPASAGAMRLAEAHRLVVRRLMARRIPILIGTDTPNPFMVPGYSLHDELAGLERQGMTRAALLRSATTGAAEFLGAAQEFGLVKPGLRADLILVDGNPLDDLSVLRRPVGVMVRGVWYARATLLQETGDRRRETGDVRRKT